MSILALIQPWGRLSWWPGLLLQLETSFFGDNYQDLLFSTVVCIAGAWWSRGGSTKKKKKESQHQYMYVWLWKECASQRKLVSVMSSPLIQTRLQTGGTKQGNSKTGCRTYESRYIYACMYEQM